MSIIRLGQWVSGSVICLLLNIPNGETCSLSAVTCTRIKNLTTAELQKKRKIISTTYFLEGILHSSTPKLTFLQISYLRYYWRRDPPHHPSRYIQRWFFGKELGAQLLIDYWTARQLNCQTMRGREKNREMKLTTQSKRGDVNMTVFNNNAGNESEQYYEWLTKIFFPLYRWGFFVQKRIIFVVHFSEDVGCRGILML